MMCLTAGLDAAILDAADQDLIEAMITAEVLLGQTTLQRRIRQGVENAKRSAIAMVPRLDPRAEESTIYRKPRAFITKKGEAILIRMLDEKTCQGLIAMYLAFQPRNSFQGLPPVTDEACTKWVQHMIGNGINIVALSFGDGVVGHAALFPMDNEVCEMFVVVSPPFQNSGIGTQLTRCSVQLAYEIGFDRIWLPVESTNVRARHVYKKCGFENLPGGHSRVGNGPGLETLPRTGPGNRGRNHEQERHYHTRTTSPARTPWKYS